jgi:hypothetical protein
MSKGTLIKVWVIAGSFVFVGVALALIFYLTDWYYWFWHLVCGLPHPFTWFMRESANAYPLWWIGAPIVLGVALYMWLWFGDVDWWWHKSEREKHLVWYLGSIAVVVAYYILVCHLWGIL